MVNTGLDRKYVASAKGAANFDPIPEGEYKLRVKEIDPWKESKKTIKVILKDENGNALKDEKGQNLTETVDNCLFYNCTVKFEVIEGEYAGRMIFHNLTTHPNMSFSIDNFLYAIGIPEISAGQIQSSCIGKECIGNVIIGTYTRTVQNKTTGIDEEVERNINRIKSLKPLNTLQANSNEYTNLGI